jgi:hypothetical protein
MQAASDVWIVLQVIVLNWRLLTRALAIRLWSIGAICQARSRNRSEGGQGKGIEAKAGEEEEELEAGADGALSAWLKKQLPARAREPADTS